MTTIQHERYAMLSKIAYLLKDKDVDIHAIHTLLLQRGLQDNKENVYIVKDILFRYWFKTIQ